MKIDEIEFFEFFNDRTFDENMFNSNGSLNKNYNSLKKTGTIAKIFDDYWNIMPSKLKDPINKFRPYADKEIQKVIKCYNKDLGCSVYECTTCKEIVFIGHTCKSRICSSCGYKYKNQRVESIMQTAYKCPHRQIVFTIPKELRIFFFEDFELINLLFRAVRDTLYSVFNVSYKKTKKGKAQYFSRIRYTPGFFSFLHTFGRDLKWNPHIHVLIAEAKIGNNGKFNQLKYFDFAALRRRFQKILLDLLSKKFKSRSFKVLKNKLYNNSSNGFYVYAEAKKFTSIQSGIEYVARYCGRVPISENRIINYDGSNVTFSFIAHEDNQYHEITVSADEFIALLVRHIVPPQFKIIRYYGFYRRKHIVHNNTLLLIKPEFRKFRKDLTKYRQNILLNFNRDPLFCPKCNEKLNYVLCIS